MATSVTQENVQALPIDQLPGVSFPSFKIFGDNIDKTVKPREETSESHKKSLHYFHSYAVKDRTEVSALQDNPHLPQFEGIDVLKVLPRDEDRQTLTQNMTIIAG